MRVGKTILVVEDEELVRNYLDGLLSAAGWSVTVAMDATQAISLVSRHRFDVVLCDFSLGPGPDGIAVLKSMPADHRTPFVLLTAYGTTQNCREALLAGASDFLEKPIAPQDLVGALSHWSGGPGASFDSGGDSQEMPLLAIGESRVRRAEQLIASRFAKADLSVADVAADVGVTPEHLARLFRAYRSQTPLENIHRVRIEAATRLLAQINLSVYEIAHDCGYRSTKDFDIWFRRFKGATPTAWRERKAIERRDRPHVRGSSPSL